MITTTCSRNGNIQLLAGCWDIKWIAGSWLTVALNLVIVSLAHQTMQQAVEGASQLSGSIDMDGKISNFDNRQSDLGRTSRDMAKELITK